MGWQKGKPRGARIPGSGRKAGTPNKNIQPLRDMILQALNEQPGGGVEYLKDMAQKNQASFSTLLGRVLPMAVTGAEGSGPLVIEIVKFGAKDA
jgi:hypothetical protein